MLLTRKAVGQAVAQPRLSRGLSGAMAKTMDRRAFLKRSGVGVGGAAVASQLPFSMLGKAEAKEEQTSGTIEVKRTVCTHCSVGCSIDAARSRCSTRR
jgi:formate dehydrogenase major subunit